MLIRPYLRWSMDERVLLVEDDPSIREVANLGSGAGRLPGHDRPGRP